MFFKLFKSSFMNPFLEEDGSGGATGGIGGSGTGSHNPDGDNEAQENKTFTQEELNKIAAKEKRQGAASILKSLGFENEEAAQEYLKSAREAEEKKKDDATKAKEALAAEKKARNDSEAKALAAERKLELISAGVPVERVEDVAILATAKATDGKSFEDAVSDLKKSFPELFQAFTNTGGTGTGGQPPRRNTGMGNEGGIGKRLAERRKASNPRKNDGYFKD